MHKLLTFKPKKKKHPKIIGSAVIEVTTMHEGVEYPFQLTCEIRITKNKQDFWVKMPSIVMANQKPKNIAHWPEQASSDIFQESIKKQLSLKYPEEFDIKKLTDNQKNIMGKARKQSKFV